MELASSTRTGMNLNIISTIIIKYFMGIFMSFKGNKRIFKPSIKSYSGVETKKLEMQPKAEYVRKMDARQKMSFEGVM